jgi:hypothetical protein
MYSRKSIPATSALFKRGNTMTTSALSAFRINLRPVLNWGVALLALYFIWTGFGKMFTFFSVTRQEQNPHGWESIVFLGFLFLGALYIAFTVLLELDFDLQDKKFYKFCGNFLKNVENRILLNSLVVWLFGLSLFPFVAVAWIDSQPHQLLVPAGTVHIHLYSGGVSTAGMSIESPRYQVSGALVQLRQSHPISSKIKTPTGEVTVSGKINFTINPNHLDFEKLAYKYKSEIRTKPDVFATVLAKNVFEPAADEMVRAVHTGMLSGSRASMVVHIGQVIHRQDTVPAWATSFEVSDITVTTWKQSFE